MGAAFKLSAATGHQLRLLLLYLHIFLQLSSATMAAAQAGEYVASFTPQDTRSFWSSKPGGNFTFGFKLVDDGEYLLAIWHSLDVNQTAIWWADLGDSSNTMKKGATLNYTSSRGALRLYDSTSSLVWQSSSDTNTPSGLQFLDTGNLKLLKVDNTTSVWESFEDRRDSLMLIDLEASKLLNNPLVLQSRRNQTSYGKGRFHMATYNRFDIHLFGMDKLNKQYVYMKDYNVSLIISGGTVSKVGNQLDGSAFVTDDFSLWRLSLDYDANLRVSQWAPNMLTWVNVWGLLPDAALTCRAQSPCGPFGLCQKDSANITHCSCPPGYTPISPGDLSKGCNSTRMPPTCGQGKAGDSTVIEEVQLGNYYYFDYTWLNYIYNKEVCKNSCLSDCKCLAATYDTASSTCFLKGNSTMGYLDNGLIVAGPTTLLLKLLALPGASEEPQPPVKKGRRLVLLIVVVVISATVAFAACLATWLYWRRPADWSSCFGRKQDNEAWFSAGPRRFSYEELVEATSNFSVLLGEGGCGEVFKGQVRDRKGEDSTKSELGMTVVAVKVLKQLKPDKKEAEKSVVKQFRAEAGMLSKIHHVNLVTLLGYCIGGPDIQNRRLLVYEYMKKGSLDRYLSPEHMKEPLPWSLRYSIAVGTARGMAYLHHDCHPRILHCDIKPQNVLLDEDFTPKVADFGLASHLGILDQGHLIVSRMKGTPGYMAPDWLKTRAITPKADVYSFGILLLELVHGLNSRVEDMSLKVWASQCLAVGLLLQDHEILSADEGSHDANVVLDEPASGLASPSAHTSAEGGESDLVQQLRCLRVALWCVHQVPAERPSMFEALQQLEGILDIQDPPNPATADNRTSVRVGFNSNSTSSSYNELIMSAMSGR